MAIEVRATKPDEYRRASNAVAAALLFPPPDDELWGRIRPSWDEQSSTSAWDGDQCVGHASQFFVETTVPGGGHVLTGAVTRVGVLPTHRRRGIATALLEALIAEASQRGAVLMSLRASEAVIYSRYGFGMAGEYAEIEIDTVRARPVSGAAPGGSFRLLDPAEIEDVVRPIYDASAHRRPGIVTRPDSWWKRYLGDALRGTKPSYVAVHYDTHGHADGFVHYDVAWNEDGPFGGHGDVHDIIATDDAAELALWGYILDIDLIRTWKAEERPLDDVLRSAVADRRAYSVTSVDDEQWVRVVDVDAALSARAYNDVNGSLTVTVTDRSVASNNGTWAVAASGAQRIEGDGGNGDLAVDISGLSAAYLGGTAWHTLAAAGAITVRNEKAIAVADNLFASRPLPFSGSFF
jgi:predicted acetyltransferase